MPYIHKGKKFPEPIFIKGIKIILNYEKYLPMSLVILTVSAPNSYSW